MFNKHEDERKRRRGGIISVIRVFLSLVMISIFGLGVFFVLGRFAGESIKLPELPNIRSVVTSEDFLRVAKGVLTVDPRTSLRLFTDLLSQSKTAGNLNSEASPTPSPQGPKLFSFAVMTDSHNDNANLTKALKLAKDSGVAFVIGLGDYSDVGTIDELVNTKYQFDSVNIPYYLTAGDHDLWDSRDKNSSPSTNFTQVFGSPYASFSKAGVRFIIIYNSDNYLGLDGLQMEWIKEQLKLAQDEKSKLTFIMTGIPIFHPTSDHVMGKTNPKLKTQAEELIGLFKNAQVAEVFAGDAHFYSRFLDPSSNLKMTVVGAITSTRNLQQPRFVLVDVFEGGSYNIQDTEIR